MKKAQSRSTTGFSAVEAIIIVLVVAVLGVGGWWAWNKNHANTNRARASLNKDTEKEKSNIPSSWKWYENANLGMKFAYPDSWTVGELQTTSTAAGEPGWTLTVHPTSRQNGDPGVTISSYPANATIKDVDAGINDVKVQAITLGDKETLTLVGTIEDPGKVNKPTQMYLSACWPRDCTPKLANGKFLGLQVGSTNNDCTRGMLCPTEINQNGENYSILIKLLESIKSI